MLEEAVVIYFKKLALDLLELRKTTKNRIRIAGLRPDI
jgi:hypothetical protein